MQMQSSLPSYKSSRPGHDKVPTAILLSDNTVLSQTHSFMMTATPMSCSRPLQLQLPLCWSHHLPGAATIGRFTACKTTDNQTTGQPASHCFGPTGASPCLIFRRRLPKHPSRLAPSCCPARPSWAPAQHSRPPASTHCKHAPARAPPTTYRPPCLQPKLHTTATTTNRYRRGTSSLRRRRRGCRWCTFCIRRG